MLTAKERWTRLDSKRSASLKRARDVSVLTIPALLPPEGHTDNSDLPTPYQSLGARGVNNLSSKMLLALLPPGTACFRLQLDAKVREQFGDEITQIEQALAAREQAVSRKVENSTMRPVLFEVLKHLIVAGNALMHYRSSALRMFRLDQYVVSRAPDGKPIECVVKESVSPAALSPEVIAACGIDMGTDQEKRETPVDVYTVIEWTATRVIEFQEINGKRVPDSDGDRPLNRTEWLPLRWQAVPGQDYGRGLGEEYLGDLKSLEGLSESIIQFAAAAAKILFLVHPNASTKFTDIVKAISGDAIVGKLADIDILQLEKFADFQVAKNVLDDLTIRLSHAFLLNSGTVRDAERVTAEEIRGMAQELEDVLGGVYTVQAQELQLPLIRLIMADMTASGELAAMPDGVVEPVIITGFEALGRNHAVNKLRAWLADLQASLPEAKAALRLDVVAKRLGVGYGVEDLSELLKTADEMAQEQQQAQASAVAEKVIGPIAQGAMKTMAPQ